MGNQIVTLNIIAGAEIKLPSSQVLYFLPINAGANSEIHYIDTDGATVTANVTENTTTINAALPLTFPVTINSVTNYINSELISAIVTDGSTGSIITYDSFSEAANIPFGVDESPTVVEGLINDLLANPTFETVTVTSNLTLTAAKYTASSSGTQAQATQLTTIFCDVNVVGGSGYSVKLPPAAAGRNISLKNNGVNPLAVFPYTDDTIDSGVKDASITIQPGASRTFSAEDSTNWETNQSITTGMPTFTSTTGITAYAGGGQTNAVALTTYYNNVTVCATANDSVKLLTAVAGTIQVVTNNGATSLAVFPYSGDTINGGTVDTAINMPSGTTLEFYSVSGTNWVTTAIRVGTGKGTVSLPAHTFNDQPDMGSYWISATEMGFAVGGAKVASVSTSGLNSNNLKMITEPGTVGAGTVTAVTNGDGKDFTTTLTLLNFVVGAFTPAAAALAMGNKIYTFPAGVHMLSVSYMSVGLVATGTANTPKIGVGSVIASGAVAVLNGTATFMDYITEQAAADIAGTVTVALKNPTAGVQTGIALNVSGSVKDVFLNVASTWAADNTGSILGTGTIVLKWTKIA